MISDMPAPRKMREFILPVSVLIQGKNYTFKAKFKGRDEDEARQVRNRLMSAYGIPNSYDDLDIKPSVKPSSKTILENWKEMKETHEIKGTQGKSRAE